MAKIKHFKVRISNFKKNGKNKKFAGLNVNAIGN